MFSCEAIPLFFFFTCVNGCVCLFPVASVTNADKKILSMCFYAQTLSCVGLRVCFVFFFVFCFLFFVCLFVCIIKAGDIGSHRDPFFLSSLPLPVCSGRKQASKKKKRQPVLCELVKRHVLSLFYLHASLTSHFGKRKKKKSKILCLFFSLLFLSLSLTPTTTATTTTV